MNACGVRLVSGLSLPSNRLSGTIPSTISALTALTYVYLCGTGTGSRGSRSWSGAAVTSGCTVWVVGSASYLDLSGNQVTGTIPSTISACPGLAYVQAVCPTCRVEVSIRFTRLRVDLCSRAGAWLRQLRVVVDQSTKRRHSPLNRRFNKSNVRTVASRSRLRLCLGGARNNVKLLLSLLLCCCCLLSVGCLYSRAVAYTWTPMG